MYNRSNWRYWNCNERYMWLKILSESMRHQTRHLSVEHGWGGTTIESLPWWRLIQMWTKRTIHLSLASGESFSPLLGLWPILATEKALQRRIAASVNSSKNRKGIHFGTISVTTISMISFSRITLTNSLTLMHVLVMVNNLSSLSLSQTILLSSFWNKNI